MADIRNSKLLLSSAGIETYLYFVQKFPMRGFAAFEVFDHEAELARLEGAVIAPVADAAAEHGYDVLLDAMVWRAQIDHMAELGYQASDVARVNRGAVEWTRSFAERWQSERGATIDVYINGDMGPRGDGYRVDGELSVADARRYHRQQVDALVQAGADVISALTMTNVAESIGIALAARDAGAPCIISPTIETNGATPDGTPLGRFIEQIEEATAGSPLFYMVNCAHPIHLEPTLRRAREEGAAWLERFSGFRANASRMSHEELDESPKLDRGHPEALAAQMVHLQADFDLRLVGGCCGTDAEHLCHMARGIAGESARLGAA
jgi:homocysteine S-methyltransferase